MASPLEDYFKLWDVTDPKAKETARGKADPFWQKFSDIEEKAGDFVGKKILGKGVAIFSKGKRYVDVGAKKLAENLTMGEIVNYEFGGKHAVKRPDGTYIDIETSIWLPSDFINDRKPAPEYANLQEKVFRDRYKRKNLYFSFSDLNENSPAYQVWMDKIEKDVANGMPVEKAIDDIAMGWLVIKLKDAGYEDLFKDGILQAGHWLYPRLKPWMRFIKDIFYDRFSTLSGYVLDSGLDAPTTWLGKKRQLHNANSNRFKANRAMREQRTDTVFPADFQNLGLGKVNVDPTIWLTHLGEEQEALGIELGANGEPKYDGKSPATKAFKIFWSKVIEDPDAYGLDCQPGRNMWLLDASEADHNSSDYLKYLAIMEAFYKFYLKLFDPKGLIARSKGLDENQLSNLVGTQHGTSRIHSNYKASLDQGSKLEEGLDQANVLLPGKYNLDDPKQVIALRPDEWGMYEFLRFNNKQVDSVVQWISDPVANEELKLKPPIDSGWQSIPIGKFYRAANVDYPDAAIMPEGKPLYLVNFSWRKGQLGNTLSIYLPKSVTSSIIPENQGSYETEAHALVDIKDLVPGKVIRLHTSELFVALRVVSIDKNTGEVTFDSAIYTNRGVLNDIDDVAMNMANLLDIPEELVGDPLDIKKLSKIARLLTDKRILIRDLAEGIRSNNPTGMKIGNIQHTFAEQEAKLVATEILPGFLSTVGLAALPEWARIQNMLGEPGLTALELVDIELFLVKLEQVLGGNKEIMAWLLQIPAFKAWKKKKSDELAQVQEQTSNALNPMRGNFILGLTSLGLSELPLQNSDNDVALISKMEKRLNKFKDDLTNPLISPTRRLSILADMRTQVGNFRDVIDSINDTYVIDSLAQDNGVGWLRLTEEGAEKISSLEFWRRQLEQSIVGYTDLLVKIENTIEYTERVRTERVNSLRKSEELLRELKEVRYKFAPLKDDLLHDPALFPYMQAYLEPYGYGYRSITLENAAVILLSNIIKDHPERWNWNNLRDSLVQLQPRGVYSSGELQGQSMPPVDIFALALLQAIDFNIPANAI